MVDINGLRCYIHTELDCCETGDCCDVCVRDHCHITGKFSSAHQECNLKLRIKPENLTIPIIFHSLHGYDSHFIMQQIGEIANKHVYTNKKEKSKTSMSMPSPIIWKNMWPLCWAII